MAHDYAKKSRSTKTPAKPRRSSKPKVAERKAIPGWVWLFVGTVMGAFVMFLVRLADIDPNEPPSARPQEIIPTSAPKPQPKPKRNTKQTKETEVVPQKPRFDFYQILKENEVPVAVQDPNDPSAKPAKPRTFILQVASFKASADAEQLKVELILLALEARTEQVTVRNGELWHRVLVGPFDNRSRLSKARNKLISNGHQALVLEYKTPTQAD